MQHDFTDSMSRKSNEDLQKIITTDSTDYLPEAVEAARLEVNKRAERQIKFEQYEDGQILEVLKNKSKYPDFEVQIAIEILKQRNIYSDFLQQESDNRIIDQVQRLTSDISVERYPALRLISMGYRILAWTVAISTVIAFIISISNKSSDFFVNIIILISGGILFITLLAIAEGIKLLTDIEYNTRLSAAQRKS
jgi:hypothetical protein